MLSCLVSFSSVDAYNDMIVQLVVMCFFFFFLLVDFSFSFYWSIQELTKSFATSIFPPFWTVSSSPDLFVLLPSSSCLASPSDSLADKPVVPCTAIRLKLKLVCTVQDNDRYVLRWDVLLACVFSSPGFQCNVFFVCVQIPYG